MVGVHKLSASYLKSINFQNFRGKLYNFKKNRISLTILTYIYLQNFLRFLNFSRKKNQNK